MESICLDKTIYLTARIMNNEEELPKEIIPIKEFGGMKRFRFAGSKVELPIEHVGLASLCYQSAVSRYIMKEITPDGDKVHLESLVGSEGSGISSFLDGVSPDALNWYSTGNRELRLNYFAGKVMSPSAQLRTGVCKSLSEEGEDLRALSVAEAYREAVRGYMDFEMQAMQEGSSQTTQAELEDFIRSDIESFNSGMEELKTESEKLLSGEQPEHGIAQNGSFADVYGFIETALPQ